MADNGQAPLCCPECEQPIGVWSVFWALTPNLVRCSGCRSRIEVHQVDRYRAAIFAAGGLFIALGIILHFVVGLPFFAVLAGLLLLWVPVEYVGSALMLRHGVVAATPKRPGRRR